MLGLNGLGAGILAWLSWRTGGNELPCGLAAIGLWIGMLVVPVSRTLGVHVAALRENFALPLLHAQTALLATLMSGEDSATEARTGTIAFAAATTLLLFCWQFAGFVLCVQLAAVFATCLLLRLTGDCCGKSRFLLLKQVVPSYVIALVAQGLAMPAGSAAELSPLPEVVIAVGAAVLFCPSARLFGRDGKGIGCLADGVCSVTVFALLRRAKSFLGLVPLSAHVDELLAMKVGKLLQLIKIASKLRATLEITAQLPVPEFVRQSLEVPLRWLLRAADGGDMASTFDSVVYLQMDEFKSIWDEGVFARQVLVNEGTKLSLAVASGCALVVAVLVFAALIARWISPWLGVSAPRASPLARDACNAEGDAQTFADSKLDASGIGARGAAEGLVVNRDQKTCRFVSSAGSTDAYEAGCSVDRKDDLGADAIFLVMLLTLYTALTALVWRLRVLALPLMATVGALLPSSRLWSLAMSCCHRRIRSDEIGGSAIPASPQRQNRRTDSITPVTRLSRFGCVSILAILLRYFVGAIGFSMSLCYIRRQSDFYATGLNPDTEQEDRWAQYKMFMWIDKYISRRNSKSETDGHRVVIAGDAVNLASVRLALPHVAVLAHPHYEEPGARKRFKAMKEYLYACAPVEDAHKYAVRLGVTHLFLDMTKLEPGQAIALSQYYKKRRRCHQEMGPGLLGMRRTFFQIILGGGHGLFKPLHIVGSYVFVQVLNQTKGDARDGFHGVTDVGRPASWRPLLDRCRSGTGAESGDSCAENLGMLVRVMANPLRQTAWVKSFATEAQSRYPKSVRLHVILARIFDYDMSDFNAAVELYRSATRLAPTDPEVWSDLGSLLSQVFGARSKQEIREIIEHQAPLVLGAPPGPGPRDLAAQRMCQAAVWSRSLKIGSKWEAALWMTAKLRGRQGCMRTNWALMENVTRSPLAQALDFVIFGD
eukprot:TRINITY_DN50048_c0_g1_i1.p1 TRINITY_DN50048_c0_g1~~TRINITY_DN50048_c0_g1_i1.p1  ORF type:complete len:971 (+),score=122.93 TRINITY_DN50048_c0_g1_i1:98-2914(+)